MSDDIRLKRLQYRAHHRGFKEADLLLGGFADSCLEQLTDTELTAFERLLQDEQDQDIYDWAIGKTPVPPEHDTPLMAKLQAFDLSAQVPWRQ